MALPFNPDVPQGSQQISFTQAPILQNFQSLDLALNGETGSGSGGGNFTTYSVQNTTANFVAKPVNPIGIFHSLVREGNPELAWINNNNAQGAGPYTGGAITGKFLIATAGYSVLFGGLIIQWGQNQTGPGVVSFPRPFPTGYLNVVMTAYADGRQYNVTGAPTTNQFTFSSNPSGGSQFYWMAIGY